MKRSIAVRNEMVMGHPWRNLVAWISVATFLIANAPSGFALPLPAASATAGQEAHCPLSSCGHFGTTGQHTKTGCALHRAFRADCQDCAELSVETGHATAPSEQAPISCPACPCPGGCVFCSVAKVPCSSAVSVAPHTDLLPGERLPESSPLLLPHFGIELLRPPRA